MIALAALAAFVLLSPPGPPPADMDKVARSTLSELLFDPFSAHVEAFGAPAYARVNYDSWGRSWAGWAACYRVNSKNRLGGYTGWSFVAFKFSDQGRLLGLVDEAHDRSAAIYHAQACQAASVSGDTSPHEPPSPGSAASELPGRD